MNFFTKIHELLRQKEQIVRIPQKHDANLQKNSTLYFQVGLIICILFTNALFEMYFETKTPNPMVYEDSIDEVLFSAPPLIEKKPIFIAKAEPKPEVKPRRLIMPPIVKPDDFNIHKEKTPQLVKPSKNSLPIVVVPPIVPPNKKYTTRNVEKVPVFPGCEGLSTNGERVKCMSEKLAKIIQRTFNGDFAADRGIEGIQRISVQFTIDKTGSVTDIMARATHQSLEKEAKRVMTKVPKMQPGKQSNIPVDVIYSLPIIFRVQN